MGGGGAMKAETGPRGGGGGKTDLGVCYSNGV
jgi:hypothetical protein